MDNNELKQDKFEQINVKSIKSLAIGNDHIIVNDFDGKVIKKKFFF